MASDPPKDHAEWMDMYRRRSELGPLRAVLDAGDERGIKNAYVDFVERHNLRRALRKVGGGVTVDLGCGVARLTGLHAEHARMVLAIDASDALLGAARRAGVPPTARLVRGDIRSIPCRDATVDLVATTGVLIHVPDPAEFARTAGEIARVLRPGGTFLAIEHITSGSSTERKEGIAYRTARDFSGCFEGAGLVKVEERAIRKAPSRLLHWAITGRMPRLFWGIAARAEGWLAHRGRVPPLYRDHLFLFRRPGGGGESNRSWAPPGETS